MGQGQSWFGRCVDALLFLLRKFRRKTGKRPSVQRHMRYRFLPGPKMIPNRGGLMPEISPAEHFRRMKKQIRGWFPQERVPLDVQERMFGPGGYKGN